MSASQARGGPQGILYISYDGMLEPLGQGQVVAYLEKLAAGRRIHLISFEKAADWADGPRCEAMRARLRLAGIEWHPRRYHKSPSAPSTAFDIAIGSALAIALARRHRIRIVHARSYVAAAMALAAKTATGVSFLFDMRGFWADERVDGGLWRLGGGLYRAAKAMERRFLLAADQVVTLTYASEREIRNFDYLAGRVPPIAVIPTCADLDRFTIQGPPPGGALTLGYVGSLGTWYLLDEMLIAFQRLRAQRPGTRLLIVNRGEQALIRQRVSALGIDPAEVEIIVADHADMPRHIARMSAAMALIKPSYSKIASAPTKLAEYLGCGVPCLGNAGVGDMDAILEGRGVGVAVQSFSPADLDAGARRLLTLAGEPGIRQRCRAVALELFALDKGVEAYAAIYDRLAQAQS